MIPADQLQDLKDRNPVWEIAGKWVKLRKIGADKWRGECPICSVNPTKKSATKFDCTSERWMCAVCMDGGDVIELVRKREGLDFTKAVEWLGGVREVDAAETAKREAERATKLAEAEKVAAQYREAERENLYETYNQRASKSEPGGTVALYLGEHRGLAGAPFHRLRCIDRMPYYVADQDAQAAGIKRAQRVVHTGPAMLAPGMRAGKFVGLHITWLDLKRDNGKAEIRDGEELLPAKKMRGSMAGSFFPLAEHPNTTPARLIIGEGIETVLSVYLALFLAGKLRAGDIFWSAGSLGNIGGRAVENVKHPMLKTAAGAARRVPGPVPDLESVGIAIPESIREIVILGDGDSDPFTTRCAVARGCARFAAPGRLVCALFAGPGTDFNDYWRGVTSDYGRAGIAETICGLLEVAKPLTAADVMAEAAPPRDSAAGARQDDAGGAAADRTILAGAAGRASDQDKPDPPDAAGARLAARDASRESPKNDPQPSRSGVSGRRSAERGMWGGDGPPMIGAALDKALAYYPLTDLGNAERFTQRNRGKLIFCPALGWLYWDGRRWANDSAGGRDGAGVRVKRAEHQTVRGIQDEAQAIVDAGEDVLLGEVTRKGEDVKYYFSMSLQDWGRASEENRRMTPIHKRAEAYLHHDAADLDSDPFMINCWNGTLVIRRNWAKDGGDPRERDGWKRINEHIFFKDHDPADLITKVSPVWFDPDAKCPIYDKFLLRVQPSADNRRHLHQCGGLALTGDISEQVMWFWWGRGKNGKSTLLNSWAHIAGDYARSVAIETFLDQGKGRGRSGGQPTPDLAALAGVRMVRTSEPEEGAKLAEALIKLATGGEPMSVRHLNMPFFEMTPRFKLVMSGNYRPKIRGTDEGIWRRMRLVPWTVTIPEGERDPDFGDRLVDEASGILNRLLDGLCDWLANRLTLPSEVKAATDEYRKDSDILGRFLESCVITAEGERVQSSALYSLFQAWCKGNGEREWTATTFGRSLSERGFARIHSDVNWWLNIRATRLISDFVDDHGNAKRGAAEGAKGTPASSPGSSAEDRPAPIRKRGGDGGGDLDDEAPF